MSIIKRQSIYYLKKWVPKRFSSVENRREVWISLDTDSLDIATKKSAAVWEQHIDAWEARLAGDTKDAEKSFDSAKRLAKARGFRYLNPVKIAALPRNERSERIEAARRGDGSLDPLEAAALLGGANEPDISVKRALELFWVLAEDKVLGKSDDQVRRWRNPHKKAIANFIEAVADKAINQIDREDMLEFRNWWMEKMKADGLTPNSANKDIIHFSKILRTVNEMKGLNIALPFGGLTLKEGEQRQRPSFSENWIRTKILADGALGQLNTEARCIVIGMINTGYRPSEAAGLLPEHIKLESNTPHISIEPVGRALKSARSRRLIPLTGVSLEAFRECPDSFPRYRESPSLSDTVNKFMRENGLLETPGHTLYGLRHAFEDRMLAAGVDERIRRDLIGHRLNRERYGAGATLEHVHSILQEFAI